MFTATAILALATVSGCSRPTTQAEYRVPREIAITQGRRSVQTSEEVNGVGRSPAIPPIVPRRGRERPIIAIVGANAGTDTTDYMVPFGVLSESGVADVRALSTEAGPLSLFPALTIDPGTTVSEFDQSTPDGADVVIVPAVHDPDDPDLVRWVQEQAEKGALVVGICDGVWALGHAGLLEGRRVVGHWYSRERLAKRFPATRWIGDRRFAADAGVVTTTGVTASIPVSLALVEAMGGTRQADSLAALIGSASWSASYVSDRFGLDVGHVWTAASNWLAFWRKETVGLRIADGVDEIALALSADAWSRTYRSEVKSVANRASTVSTRRGLDVVPDVRSTAEARDGVDRLVPVRDTAPVLALDETLVEIGERYGARTRAFVELQIEYVPTVSGADR